jgi:hypothetical protein
MHALNMAKRKNSKLKFVCVAIVLIILIFAGFIIAYNTIQRRLDLGHQICSNPPLYLKTEGWKNS